jgi:ribosomal protein L37AE/L43A
LYVCYVLCGVGIPVQVAGMNGETTQKIKAIIKERYDTFVRIHINHVYKCESCKQYLASKSLSKRGEIRVCPMCGKEVNDVTFTWDAEAWRAMVRPDLEISKNDTV